MFADDTNLFCLSIDIETVFKYNLENKTKFTHFHRIQDTDKLPIRLPALKLNEYAIKISSPIKFLRTAAEELLNRTDYINILENKPSKNLGLLYKSKRFLNAILSIFFHTYLNYGNIACSSTSMTKNYSGLKIEDLKKRDILDIYKLNISHVINLVLKMLQYQDRLRIILR